MRKITYREAVIEALREEMQRDERGVPAGRGHRASSAAATRPPRGSCRSSARSGCGTRPSPRRRSSAAALGSALLGMRPVAELMYIDFAGIAMDQIVNQTAKVKYMFGGKAKVPVVDPDPGRHRPVVRGPARAEPGGLVRPRARPEGRHALHGLRPEGPAQGVHPGRQSGLLHRAQAALRDQPARSRRRSTSSPSGKADVKRQGKDVTIVATSRMVQLLPGGGGSAGGRGDRVRGDRPQDAGSPWMRRRSSTRWGRPTSWWWCARRRPTAALPPRWRRSWPRRASTCWTRRSMRVTSMHTPTPFAPKLEKFVTASEEKIMAAVKTVLG